MTGDSEHLTAGANERANERESAGAVTYLDQALWQQLNDASDQSQFAGAWLSLQCAMIAGVQLGMVILKEDEAFMPVASWPEVSTGSKELVQAAEHSLREQRGIVQKPEAGGAIVAYPFQLANEIRGVVSLKLEQHSDIQLRSVMRQLQWGASWFETFFHRGLPQELSEQTDKMAMMLKLVATSLEEPGFSVTTSAIATELATMLDCERVSIGFTEKNHMKLKALSHSAQFDKKTNLVRQIELAMDEAMDQLAAVIYPNEGKKSYIVNQAHRQLIETSGAYSVCTVLVIEDDEVQAAITFEHTDRNYFSEKTTKLCSQAALVIGPILELKRREDRLLIQKTIDSVHKTAANILRPDHLTLKVFAIAVLLVTAMMGIVDSEHRVSADATIEGRVQRHISAPVDGYVMSASVRAGDMVKKGDPLFSLDDKDLRLEKMKWVSQRQQVEQKYRDALARHKKAEASIQKAQLDQSNAQISLLDAQLARSNATAPFDGLVVSGDLSQKLGAPVQKGDTLLKIAPLDGYRIVLEVDELDITGIKIDQTGELSLSAFPGQTMNFVVEKITPEAKGDSGRNFFVVEASLQQQAIELRPGMQGTGKIHVGERKLIWIWTHKFFDWFQVWTWSWWP